MISKTTQTFLARLLELRASEMKVERLQADLLKLEESLLKQRREIQRLKAELFK